MTTTQTTTPTTEALSTPAEPARPFSQRLVLYHATGAGSGAAMQLEPRVNRHESDRYNCFFLEMAAQKTAASRGGGKTVHATFDWEHKLTVKLDFPDICELLAVLEGKNEKVGGHRNGIYHETAKANTMITLQKAEKGGYFMGLSRKDKATGQLSRVQITLSEVEAIGLRSIFQSGLFLITFHTELFWLRA